MRPFARNALLIEARKIEDYAERLGVTEATQDAFKSRFGVVPLERMVGTNQLMASIWGRSTASSPVTTGWNLSHLNTFFYTQGGLAAFLLRVEGRYNPHELVSILTMKQDMYGPANLQTYGEMGIVIRISDKISRLQTLNDVHGSGEHGDSYQDTLVDIAGYSVLGLVMISER